MKNLMEGIAFISGQSEAKIHFDLKPGNVVIDDTKTLRIIDFGAIRKYFEGAHTITQIYSAPEFFGSQVRTLTNFKRLSTYTREYAAAYDTWAAGAIYWELLCREGSSFHPEGTRIFTSQEAVTYQYDQGCKFYNGTFTTGRGSDRDFAIIKGMLAFDPLLPVPMAKRSKPYQVIQQLETIIGTFDMPPPADSLPQAPPRLPPVAAPLQVPAPEVQPGLKVHQVPPAIPAPVRAAPAVPAAPQFQQCTGWYAPEFSTREPDSRLFVQKFGSKDCWYLQAANKLPCLKCTVQKTNLFSEYGFYLKGDILRSPQRSGNAGKLGVIFDPYVYRSPLTSAYPFGQPTRDHMCHVEWVAAGQYCGWLKM